MSTLWDSLIAQLDAEDLDALAAAVRPLLAPATAVPASSEAMLSVAQVAERRGVCAETVRRAIRSGELPAVRVGSRLRIDPADLDRWDDSPRVATSHSAAQARRRSRRSSGVMTHALSQLSQSVSL